ncbi:energy-coupled thiamine transporter ThiT [Thermoflavimicrobium dichotomicum]|uniref:Thiamine transporter n=1 Tax=Thermoflavimicrobium dichotomicum TaxID=46223 RepID=A0A1I3SVU4_9BACL|nr:energy-coupled thiamine transporter ThiT [Thermoflavimicrobium dichotomicum]SFJ61681.1 thiamine transporter [Thermoflavimicrobium dichotomicum]
MNQASKKLVTLIEVAIMAAIAVVFDKMTIYQAPYGGSVTLSMVPIVMVALRRGMWPGIACGVITGVLQLITEGYVVHPVQAILDYPVAYGVLGVAGWVLLKESQPRNAKMLRSGFGILMAGLSRTLAHFLSGIIFFASMAPKGQSPYLYSLIYNAAYMIPNMIIAFIITLILIYTAPQLVHRQ